MARTKRKVNVVVPATAQVAATQAAYRTGGYVRLSLADGGKPGADTLEGQRNLIQSYIENQPNMAFRGLYCDNGKTGTDFDRPAFEQLMEDVKSGKINCIVVKDLSRFGRNYKEVGNLLERVFPFLGVRFIAINDNFDTLTAERSAEGYIAVLLNIVNEMYSKDLSAKLSATFHSKQKNGDYIGANAPYGYIKDPEDINHLIADTESSNTVRYIFQMAASGLGSIEITRILNAENVPTPMMHKLTIGTSQRFMTCINEDNFWMQSAVARILRDERYTGKNIYGRRTRDMIGNSHTILTSRDSWVVVDESHDVIVTQEEYAKAQNALREYHEFHGVSKSNRPLRGKLVCGVCGHIMCRSNGTEGYYYCKTSKHTDAYACHDNILPEAEIIDIVLTTIRSLARLAVKLENLIATKQHTVQLDRKELFKTLQSLQQKKTQFSSRLESLYEEFVDKKISLEEYTKSKQSISLRLEEYAQQIATLEQKADCLDVAENNSPAIDAFKNYTAVDTLSDTLSTQLLERVKVYPNGSLDLQFNFQNELEALARAIQ